MKKKPPRKTPRQCESCNRMCGVPRVVQGISVEICDECFPSEFRRGRVIEGFMVAAFIRATEEIIKCSSSTSVSV